MACPHLQEREYRAGPENLAPKPKAKHVHSSAIHIAKKGSSPVSIG